MSGSHLARALEVGRAAVTADLLPPRGGNLTELRGRVSALHSVTAVNVADMPSARLAQHPLAAARMLVEEGIEPVLQLTGRDRNRLALQADLLAASALEIENVLALTGDHLCFGDHPHAKPVFDLSSTELLTAVEALRAGRSLEGEALDRPVELFAGAAINANQEPLEPQLLRARVKQQAGARFFQTQPVFLVEQAESFLQRAVEAGISVPILLGVFLLESGEGARFMNERVPGVSVPARVLRALDEAADPAGYGVSVVEDLLDWVRATGFSDTIEPRPVVPPAPAGVHVMSLNRFETVGRLAARLLGPRARQD